MDKQVWGPIYWYVIHKASENINNIVILDKIKRFYLILPHILPCHICANHSSNYIKLDNPNMCQTGIELFRWTLRFHNNTNILLGKKTYYYNILQKYKRFLNHKKMHSFINILNKLLISSKDNLYKKYYNETIELLQYIFKCKVCCENLYLLKNVISPKINLDNFMYSHFPTKNSKSVYINTGIKSKGIKLKLKNNIITGKIYNDCNIYKYYPVLPDQKYNLLLNMYSVSENALFVTCNDKPCGFTINNKETCKLHNDINFIEIKTPPSNLSSELLKINIKNIFSTKGIFVLKKININIS